MKKKIIDIYAPHARGEIDEEEYAEIEGALGVRQKNAPRGSRTMTLAFLVFLLAALPAGAAHVLYAKIEARVWPEVTKFEMSEAVTAVVGATEADLKNKLVRAARFEQEKEVSGVFAASGKQAKNAKARGAIRVYNENSQAQTLVANTRFISENGELFHSESRVMIPASSALDVEVVAAESGEAYNIDPSNFSLPGLVGSALYTKIHGESFDSMRGGAAMEVARVEAGDIASAKEQLTQQGFREVREALQSGIPAEFALVDRSLVSSVVEDKSAVKEGAEMERFHYRLRVRVSGVGYHTGDLDAFAMQALQGHAKAYQTVDKETLALQVQADTPLNAREPFDSLGLRLKIAAHGYGSVDTAAFTRRLRGVSAEDLPELMKEYPYVAQAQFSFWPFWRKTAPKSADRVDVQLVVDPA